MKKLKPRKRKLTELLKVLSILMFLLTSTQVYAVIKTSNVVSGNWGTAASWLPVGVPTSTDNVVIKGGNTITVDGAYACAGLDLGDVTAAATTLKITTAGNSLTITGDLRINPSNKAFAYTFDAGPGSFYVNGTFSTWGTLGTNTIKVAAGNITFVPAVTIANATENITFYGAGIVNFNGAFTDNYNKLVTYAACVVNFASTYTTGTTIASWAAKGTANFTGSACAIIANTNLTLYNVQVSASQTLAINNASGNTIIGGALTLAGGSAFNLNKNIEIDGNWVNNGGTLNGATNTVIFNGTAQSISGSSPTTFPTLQIGNTVIAATVACTMSTSNTCANLVFAATTKAGTLTLGSATVVLTVTNDLTINQPAGAVTNNLAVNAGACTVGGNLYFTGSTNTATWISKITVTTGSFTLNGTVTWMSNTLAATEVITASTGTITFNSSVSMGTGSGTLSLTGAGTINFNGTTAPSFAFGGAATSPVFTSYAGCTLNFKNGFTNNTNALTLAATSNTNFTGDGAITANANITFGITSVKAQDTVNTSAGNVTFAGIFTLASGSGLVLNRNIEADANWVNNGGTLTGGSNTVIFNGAAAQTISGNATAFPTLQIGNTAVPNTVAITMSASNSCAYLTFASTTKAGTLTLSSSAVALTITNDLTINQPAGIVTNNLAINTASCTVGGNLYFNGTANTATWVSKITVTTGSFTLNGTVTWMNNTLAATEVITATTGTLTFNSSLTMGTGSGTLSLTGAGTINFNGTTSPSFAFGGAATIPVFTSYANCNLNFKNGFTNNTNALTLAATTNTTFTGNGVITANANITFGIVNFNGADTIASATGNIITAGVLTLAPGSALTLNKNFEADGNWVNSGGTLDGGNNTVMFNGTAQTISGNPTSFPTLQIGNTAIPATVACTMNNNNTCSYLTFASASKAGTLTLGSSAVALAITNDLTINQPAAAVTNNLVINAGACTVGGNLYFTGAVNTTSWVSKITVTSGSFALTGNLTWMSNTAIATEVISVTTGTLTFNNSLTMGTGSGTLTVSGGATINFNGTTAPSFNFGGVATSPSFTTTANCVLNFKNGFTNNSVALALAYPSTANFTGSGTITGNAGITFGTINITSGATVTLASAISLKGNWNDLGSFVPGTYAVIFNTASPNIQTITKDGGETFYSVTATTTGSTLVLANSITITSQLTMSGMRINLNNNTLTLGNNAAATLTYTAGIAYGGTWRRWIPVAALSSTATPFYGLFPIGTSTDYRPLAVNSTVNPTGAGYLTATNTNSNSTTAVMYTDNEGAAIQAVSLETSTLANESVTGGTYNINATFTALNSSGVVTDLKLETYTDNIMGSVGLTATSTGTVVSPTVKRTGLNATQLSNVFAVSSKNITITPLGQFYYARKSGNWDDTTATGTWARTPGGAACSCRPTSNSNVYITAGDTVTSNVRGGYADYVYIYANAVLSDNGLIPLTINHDINTYGNGQFKQKGTWTIANSINLSSTSVCTINGSVTMSGPLNLPAGAALAVTAGSLTLNNNVTISGNIALDATTQLNMNGSAAIISGTGAITGPLSSTITITGDKTIASGTTLVLGNTTTPNTLNINGTATVTNNGNIKVYGDLTGTSAASNWVNNPNATLEVTGSLLATGTLDASASPNTVTYSGSGNQIIKAPLSSYYDLAIANSGTKTAGNDMPITDELTLQDSVILDESTYALTGDADLIMSGKPELKLQRSTSGTYPELTGDITLTGGTVTINQTAGAATVANGTYYNLKLAGTTAAVLSGVSTIQNNLTVQNASSFTSANPLIVTGTLSYSSSATTTLSSRLTIGGLALAAGGLNDGGHKIFVNGSAGWQVTGGVFTSTGTETFNGAVAQTIGGSIATSFNNLVINNSSGVTLNVSPAAATIVSNLLTLTNGVVHTTSTNILRILNNASSTTGSSTSYVDGPLVKVGNDDFVFPIGNKGKWRRAAISGISDSLTEVTGQYFAAGYTASSPLVGKLTSVSPKEYWTIERTAGSDSMYIKLYWDNAAQSDIVSYTGVTIAHYTGGHWIEEKAVPTEGSGYSGTASGSITTKARISSFSPFTFGSEGQVLPIKLISFTGQKANQDADALLNWNTAAEENNDHFDVELAVDNSDNNSSLTFTKIGEVKGAGTATVENTYSFTDDAASKNGTRYYRLKQVDVDGNFTYSNIIALQFTGNAVTETMASVKPLDVSLLYPNPVSQSLHFNITSPNTRSVIVRVSNLIGQEVFSKTEALTGGLNAMSIDVSHLHTGIFVVGIIDGDTRYAPEKFEKY